MMTYHTRAPTLPDVSHRRRYTRTLDPNSVMELALSISKRLSMTILNPQRIWDGLRENQTVTYRGQDYTLWIDRQYIAVAPYGIAEVTYLYVTRHHIIEETRTDRALRVRHRPTALDSKARSQLASALSAMDREWLDYAVRRSVVDEGCDELDLKAPWN